MATFSNRRKSARYLWSGFVISTIIGCAAFVYISLQFGTDYYSEAQKYFSNSPEQIVDEICMPVCNSKECVAQSNYLLNYMEPTVDPCENYYDFACGKFLKKFSQNESRIFIEDPILEMKLILKRILENIEADPTTAKGKLKIVYDSCLKYSSSNFQAIPGLSEFLSTAGIPNWPNLDPNFQFSEKNLTSVLGKFLTYDEYGFINVKKDYPYVKGPDSKFKTNILKRESIYKRKETLFRKYLTEKILEYYKLEPTSINQIWEESEAINDAITFLEEENRKKYEEENEEKEDNEADEDVETSITCGPEAEARWEFACGVLESYVENGGFDEVISKQFATIPSGTDYFIENIFHVLKNFSDRSIANYLALNVLFFHLDHMNFLFKVASQKDGDFMDLYLKRWKDLTPWQDCMNWLMSNMVIPLTFEYLKEFTKEGIDQVVSLIQESMQETADAISTQDWMTEPVKMEVAEEVKNITLDMRYMKMLLMEEADLDAFYEEFRPSNASFLHNLFKHNRFSMYEDYLDRHELAMLLPTRVYGVNILIPGATGGDGVLDLQLGLLLPPVYRSGLSKPFDLLSLVSIIAHEIGHSLQIFTRKFKVVDPEAKVYVDNTFLCIINQYSKFKYKIIEKNVNGSNSIMEDFADTVAMSIIDNLIEKYASSDNSSLLPGLPYTAKQMFYISALELWCGSDSERDEIYNHECGSHSLGRFRMLGMLQNSKGFAKAFNCPVGSYMNPETKCTFPK